MAVVKPDVLVTQAVYQLEGKFKIKATLPLSASASSMVYSPTQYMLDTRRRRPMPETQDDDR